MASRFAGVPADRRRLAAVMFTDLAGYSAHSHADEAGALALLDEQAELVRPVLAAHRGRRVKAMGDGLLVEFPNALAAVECAVDLQRRAFERNSRTDGPALRLRVGIHLGDVERRGADILGDTVNVAARIEPLADPGGVCLSEQVYDQVRNRVAYQLERVGPKTLKGIREPVDVFRVRLPWLGKEAPAAEGSLQRLAVLPLANISPDPKDEYFADGLTEELITVLSQLRELRVIARTSVTQYKAAPKPIAQVGAELGVDSVLEGSVRKAGNRLRITVQLIEVASQEHSWAETYDRELDDVFAVQTEVAKRVAQSLKVRIKAAEAARIGARPAVHPDSYLAYLKGKTLLSAGYTESGLQEARRQFERAIALDPANAAAYSGLSIAIRIAGWSRLGASRADWEPASRAAAARAMELDPNLAEAHGSLAIIHWDDFEYPESEKEFRRALALNPSYAIAHEAYAAVLEDMGRTDEALREYALAEEADPRSPEILKSVLLLLIWLRRWDEAETELEKLKALDPQGGVYRNVLPWYFSGRSEVRRALEAVDGMIAPEPQRRCTRAQVYARAGERRKANALLERLQTERPGSVGDWELGFAHGLLGQLDECFRWLGKAVDEHQIAFQAVRLDPGLEAVREDPRFAELLRKMNLA